MAIDIRDAEAERNAHLYKRRNDRGFIGHCRRLAVQAAAQDTSDPFVFRRVYSHLLSGNMVEADVPKRISQEDAHKLIRF